MKTLAPIEPLESRIAPAAVFKFTDVDGDAVTIATSKGVNADLAAIVTVVDEGLGKELQRIDFSLNATVFAGTGLTITAKRTAAGGDGLVNVGFIDASVTGGGTALDLGSISIRGDLGGIEAGDASTGTLAVKGLSVQSMGEFGTSTQQAGGTLLSTINGALGFLKVTGNLRDAAVVALGGLDGKIGAITIGGSLIGGSIQALGAMGLVKIGGNLEGGRGNGTGIVSAITTLAGITIGGSLLGGDGLQSGEILSNAAMGPVKIGGNVVGGSQDRTGFIHSDTTVASITIGGSLIGGQGSSSGQIDILGALGSVKIGGNIEGGDYDGAGAQRETGHIEAGRIGSLFIGGSILAGTNSGTGTLIDSGSVRVADDIGSIVVKGSLIGNTTNPVIITARGQAVPTATADVAIKSLTVSGRVEHADILAGYFPGGIGSVTIGGDVIGGAANRNGLIQGEAFITKATIGGSVVGGTGGGAGNANKGMIYSNQALGSVSIGGDLIGGAGVEDGAVIGKSIGSVKVGGDVRGGAGEFSGTIDSIVGQGGNVGTVTIGGSLLGGAFNSGRIYSDGDLGAVKIGGDLEAGTGDYTGYIEGRRIASVTIAGSIIGSEIASRLNAAQISARADLGAILIGGSLRGSSMDDVVISAKGSLAATATADVAIKSLKVIGGVQRAAIFAGSSPTGVWTDTNAQIGAITIGGSFLSGFIAAGTLDTTPPAAGISKIASISIGGEASGAMASHKIVALKISDAVAPLTAGADTLNIGPSASLLLRDGA